MTDEGYNGYTNYETWCTVLWLSNDECLQQRAAEIANDPMLSGIEKDDAFKDWIESENPLNDLTASVYSDLMSCAISGINWTEVTEAFAEED